LMFKTSLEVLLQRVVVQRRLWADSS
jgi:hypothetical protein